MYAKLINGELYRLKMPLRVGENDVFTNDESIIRANGYKLVVYTNMPSETAVPSWQEAETQIIQTWTEPSV